MFIDDTITFFVVLWLLFAVELAYLIPSKAIFFRAIPFNGFQWSQPPALIGNQGISFLNPLVIGEGIFIAETTAARFELAAAHERRSQFLKAVRPIRTLSQVLQFLVLFAFPLGILFWGAHVGLAVFVTVFLFISQFIARKAWWIAGTFGLADKWERIGITAKIALYPIATIFSVEILSTSVLKEFHPVVVAVELKTKNWKKLAEISWRSASYPLPDDNPEAKHDERSSLEKFLKSQRIDVDQLKKAPEKREPGAISYCPRCLTQFRLSGGACTDCQRIPLVIFR